MVSSIFKELKDFAEAYRDAQENDHCGTEGSKYINCSPSNIADQLINFIESFPEIHPCSSSETRGELAKAKEILINVPANKETIDGEIYYYARKFNPKNFEEDDEILIEAILVNRDVVIKKLKKLDFDYDHNENNSLVVKYWKYSSEEKNKVSLNPDAPLTKYIGGGVNQTESLKK